MSMNTQSNAFVQLPATLLGAIQRGIESDRSHRETAQLLRQAGLECGESFYEEFRRQLPSEVGASRPEDLGSEEFWDRLGAFFRDLGWGDLKREAIHPGVLALISDNWVEAQAEQLGSARCHLTTGVLAELMRRIADDDVGVLEVECRSAGAGRCCFLVGSVAMLAAVYEGMQKGMSYRHALQQVG